MTNAISGIINKLRLTAGFDTLGELSRVSDVTVATLSRIESGDQIPSPKTLQKLAPFLNVDHRRLMIAAGHLSPSNVGNEDSPNDNIQPTPPDRIRTFQKKMGELSEESLTFLEYQLERLRELDEESVKRRRAERDTKRDKK